ncbi:MAG: hypothetical protein M3Y03_05465 [Verrucomicrobiota bacterium]|nr:hypothetical protein [Verrucomicrobiota bacterium]
MKKFLAVFVLTAPEQRVIILLLTIAVAVVAARSYRLVRPLSPAAEVQPSPSPGTRP